MNVIFGGAGFAKEIDWVIEELWSTKSEDYRVSYFVVEDGSELIGKHINRKDVVSEGYLFKQVAKEHINCFVAVGDPSMRERIVSMITNNNHNAVFPRLIEPTAKYDKREGCVNIGKGTFICANSVITTAVNVGSYVHINLSCTIGHDCSIGDFSTLSPGVNVSGNVIIGKRVFIGTGAAILERVSICSDVVIGAMATVIKSINEPGVYVGTPARKIE